MVICRDNGLDECSNMKVPGVYTLLLNVSMDLCTIVGSLGYICIDSGMYSYIGSARGFGGIEARVKRHIDKDEKRLWWHIDYITSLKAVKIVGIVYAETVRDLEYMLANFLERSSCWSIAVPRFGSTDKRSSTHLFRCLCSFSKCLDELTEMYISIGLRPCVLHFNNHNTRPER